MNQDDIIAQNGLQEIVSLAHHKPSPPAEQLKFTQILLRFCERSAYLKFTSLLVYFIPVFVHYFKQKATLTDSPDTVEKKRLMRYNALDSIAYVSLRRSTHKHIFTVAHIELLLRKAQRCEKILFKHIPEKNMHRFEQKLVRYLKCVQVLTNCLMTVENRELLATEHLHPVHDDLMHFLVEYQKMPNFYDKRNHFQLSFAKNLQRECLLALCLLENPVFVELESQRLDEKATFLLRVLKTDEPSTLGKALTGIASLSKDWQTTKHFTDKNIHEYLVELLTRADPSLAREIARTIANLIAKPEGIVFWLKFDSDCLSVDSSCTTVPLRRGEPKSLPEEHGLYRNWGAFFTFGDMIEVRELIEFPLR